jgi:prophage DNA circulation protein
MSGTASGLGPWAANLQQASWRGQPFVVKSSTVRRGRRVAVHEYPFRDVVWVEDLGRGTRTIGFTGFLIGDDVYSQRSAMLAAAETAGPGTLVHPSLGMLQASLTDFSAGERAELGRVVEIEFSFIQTGQDQPLYPTPDVSTQDVSNAAADACDAACGADFLSHIQTVLAAGEAVTQGLMATATGAVAKIIGTEPALSVLAGQATALPSQMLSQALAPIGQSVGMISDAAIPSGAMLGLPGYFGSYSVAGLTAALPDTATIESQLSDVCEARAAVMDAGNTLLETAESAPENLAGATQSLIASITTVIPSPNDQLRILTGLTGFGR